MGPDAGGGSPGASSLIVRRWSGQGHREADSVCKCLANQKAKKKGNQRERLLDLAQGSEGWLGSSKKAAALRVFETAVDGKRKLIYESIESNRASFAARQVRPGEPRSRATARAWLESHSSVQNSTRASGGIAWGGAGKWQGFGTV